jgi:uncharacterized protein YajQ (UPF0234 family)
VAKDFSFDVVSDFDSQELLNALDQARREIGTRYDFKGAVAEIKQFPDHLELTADSEFRLKAIIDVLQSKLVRRQLDLRILDPQTPVAAAKGTVRQELRLRRGIDQDRARELTRRIRASHPKVVVRVQGDAVRVSSPKKDDLQGVIATLRSAEFDLPLQFQNYR